MTAADHVLQDRSVRSIQTVFTVRPGTSLLDAVAEELLHPTRPNPPPAETPLLLLPTRRACVAMRDALLRQSGGSPLLAPRILPLGDLDPDGDGLDAPGSDGDLGWADAWLPPVPPAIAPLRRQLLLAGLIAARGDVPVGAAQALALATALARLIDLAHTERVPFDRLDGLVPEHLAEHWQRTLDFLAIVTTHWPNILQAEGCIDPADRRDRVLRGLAEHWGAQPPDRPVWVLGSTGSIPATADVMVALAHWPDTRIVLPGLDRDLDDESWDALDETHPQSGLKRLLDRLGIARAAVGDWPAPPLLDRHAAPPPDRSRLIREAMRPPATTEAWRRIDGLSVHAVRGIGQVHCATDREEAAAIAVAMRAALHDAGTCALITADRTLARRVGAALQAWGLAVDDSAGVPLTQTGAGGFLRLVVDAAASGLDPVGLLALLKHPLAAAGLARDDLARRVRKLDKHVLRGPAPGPGVAALRAALDRSASDGWTGDAAGPNDLLDRLAVCLGPLIARLGAGGAQTIPDLVTAHITAAEALAATDAAGGAARLWQGDDGEAAAALLSDLLAAANGLPPLDPGDYPAWITALMAVQGVRPRHGTHPRLAILGTLEARLQAADTVILGGLNEGTWPADPPVDPWMSRPMRAAFGLSPTERRIGLAAHDFTQALAGPTVLLTRAERVGGAPTVPSRWLVRLDAVLHRAGPDGAALELGDAGHLVAWANRLVTPAAGQPRPPPEPRPPQAARPRRFSVTEIGTLLSDPYQIYAKRVLGLVALDPLNADPDQRDRGTAIHDALAAFVTARIDPAAPDAVDRLLDLGRKAFGAHLQVPGVAAVWWPRFQAIAAWFVATQAERAPAAVPLAVEVSADCPIPRPADAPDSTTRTARLVGRIDRIDRLADGGLTVLDYKTGRLPSPKQITHGFAPQLPLEAGLIQRGAVAGVPADPVARMAYWKLSGGAPAGQEETIPKALGDPEIIARSWDGMLGLLSRFDDPAMPFRSQPTPENIPDYSDYRHLARVREWSAGADGADDAP